jgi:hypothetical protein
MSCFRNTRSDRMNPVLATHAVHCFPFGEYYEGFTLLSSPVNKYSASPFQLTLQK